ncbi:phage tail tape measure protein [Pedobacter sp. Leaf250]|uniref:phage tail tape measure protein n=1 Tax=Pedobacter sp. Leaf250 TaxID=2876559 RepID=UPI001E5DACD3|nr:phage tail tape measure protein [Pedobacter sp. Leaf250]
MASGSAPRSIRASLYIDGKPAENSIKSLTDLSRKLERELNQLTVGTEEWQRKLAQLQAARGHLQNIRNEVRGVSGAFAQIREELGKFGTLAAGYLGFQFITSQFQGIIAGNAKLSDSLADVRRVTGLTEAGVLNLDKSLGKLDTRTSKSELRGMAIIAGKLGVAKTEILSFVEATDKLTVALGDELGNADQITTQLGKILNVFDGKVTGDNITTLGNAMVKLANDGVASAGFIADFTQRVSGIAKTAGMSLPATLAIGAGIEELGGRSESAATAMQKLLLSISSDTPKAAKIAGMSLKAYTKLLADGPEQALLKYTRGLVANKNAFSEVTKSLDDAGEEGARTIETITKLGQNTEFFAGKITDASTAIIGYNEINEAFNLKNQTLGAQVEKLGKDFNSLSSNKTLVNFLTTLVILASSTVRWIKENSEAIGRFVKMILIGTAAWLGYRTALVAVNLWTTLTAAGMATLRSVTLLLALAKAKLTGDTLRAAAAQRLLGVAMAANPYGVILAIIGSLTAAYVLFSSKIETAAQIQHDLNQINQEALKNSMQETDRVKGLAAALNKQNLSLEAKQVIVDKLRAIMPDYLKSYTDEQIKAGKATTAINNYVAALQRKTRAQAATDAIQKIQSENIELEKVWTPADLTGLDKVAYNIDNALGKGKEFMDGLNRIVKMENAPKLFANKARVKEISAQNEDVLVEQMITPDTKDPAGNLAPSLKPNKKAETAAAKAAKKAKEDAERLATELLKISNDLYLKTLEKNDEEVESIRLKYAKLKADAKGNSDTLLKIQALEGEEMRQLIAKQKADEDKIIKDAADKLAKEKLEVEKQIFEATASSYDLEVAQAVAKYDELIRQAKLFGIATIALENAKQKELDRIKRKKDGLAEPDDPIEAAKKAKEKAKKEKEDKIQFAFEMASEISNTAFSIGENARRQESDARLSQLEKDRETELSNKSLTEDQKNAINEKYNEKIKIEKTKAWENEKKAAITQALINGALAATNIWATTPKVDFGVSTIIMLAAAAASTVASVASIASQKPPEFAQGGMSNEDPSGYVSSTTLFNRSSSGRPFVAGEAGKEWIAPNWMLQNPVYANIIGSLEVARKEKRMYAIGGFNGENTSSTTQDFSYSFAKLENLVMTVVQEQRRFNNLPIVNEWQVAEEYARKLQNDRASQMG